MNLVQLTVGDWSDDGHGKTSTYNVLVSCSEADVNKYYELGTKIIGFDFSDEVATHYEDSILPNEYAKKLSELGFDLNSLYEYDEDEEEIYLDCDGFVRIFMFIASLGYNSVHYEKFQWEFGTLVDCKIGGYGLFW